MKNEKMFVLLSAYYALESKIRNYHWNVEGDRFVEYHKFFEDCYKTVANEIDEIAEQICKLGEKVPANLVNFVDTCKKAKVDLTNRAVRSCDMVCCMLAANDQIVDMIKDLKKAFGDKKEYIGASVMLDGLLTSREKCSWFLKNLTKGHDSGCCKK